MAAAATVVLCSAVAAVTIAGSASRYDWAEGIARALIVGVPIGVGLYGRRASPFPRFGTLLVALGLLWSVASLSSSQNDVLYSVGRIAGWFAEIGIIYLVLAYPTGRLRTRADRALVALAVLLTATLYLPTVLFTDAFPLPSPFTSCVNGCAENAFQVAAEPAFFGDVLRPFRELLTLLLFAAAIVRMGQRLQDASRLTKLTLTPVIVVAIVRFGAFVTALPVRRADPEAPAVAVLAFLLAFALPAVAVAFVISVIRWRLFIASAVQRLATKLRGHPRPEDLRAALSDAFEDPSLQIAYWLDDVERWGDEQGRPIVTPLPSSGRVLTEVMDGDRLVAAMIHDRALSDDQAFIGAASAYAVMTLENHRLSAQAAALLREARGSRARIQKSADDERRRIERDLHDGAQQRLVALRIKLELAAEGMEDGDAVVLRSLGDEVDDALDEVRSLARGIYPAPLADRGLVEALRAAALRAPLPTTVLATGMQRRYSREIESATYFSCLEALQNAAKHAVGATAVVVELSDDDGALHFAVRDDGQGFDQDGVALGLGLINMRDRIAAVGGDLVIESRPGAGTRVSADIALTR